MKILKHGIYGSYNEKHERVCTISCACGCEFQFTKDDPCILTKIYPNGRKHRFTVCPECGNIFPIKGSFFLAP